MKLKSNILIILIPFITILIIVLLVAGLTLFSRRVLDQSQDGQKNEIWIYQDHGVGFPVVPNNDGLNTIKVFIKNPYLRNKDPFEFSLLDKNENIVRKISINGSNIGDGELVRFQFDPIADSGENRYTIHLSAPITEISQSVGTTTAFEAYYRPQNKSKVFMDVTREFGYNILDWRLWIMIPLVFIGVRFWIVYILEDQ